MNRRNFIKTSIGAGATLALTPLQGFPQQQTKPALDPKRPRAYQKGAPISTDAFVVDQQLKRRTLMSICEEHSNEATLNMLYIFGGGALDRDDKLGGLWCGDSFEDLQIMRFVHSKYEASGLKIIPVACAPVYSSKYYGLEDRVFLDEPHDSIKFEEAATKFVESTVKLVDSGFIPVKSYFDLRLRLLFNSREDLKPGDGYGEIFEWQGKFRAEEETQKYGVPTIWLLDPEGRILEGPFRGNIYHSDPYEINYTVLDIDKTLQKYL